MKITDQSSCLCCQYFRYTTGCQNYSEWTPGYDAEIECLKSHWKVNNTETSENEFRDYMIMSVNCNDFKELDTYIPKNLK